MSNLLPQYDRWLDAPIERELEARVGDEEDGELDGAEEDCAEDGLGDY